MILYPVIKKKFKFLPVVHRLNPFPGKLKHTQKAAVLFTYQFLTRDINSDKLNQLVIVLLVKSEVYTTVLYLLITVPHNTLILDNMLDNSQKFFPSSCKAYVFLFSLLPAVWPNNVCGTTKKACMFYNI